MASASPNEASAQNQSIASSRVALQLVAAPGAAPLTLSLSRAIASMSPRDGTAPERKG